MATEQAAASEPSARGGGWADVGLAVAILLLCSAVLWASIGLPGSPYEPLGPASFPRGVALAMIILALAVLGGGVKKLAAAGDGGGAAGGGGAIGLAVGAYALTAAFIAMMPLVGFRIGSVAYVFALGVLLTRARARALLPVAALALLLGLGSHYLFTAIFVVDLP